MRLSTIGRQSLKRKLRFLTY